MKMTDEMIASLKEKFGDDKAAAYLEISKAVEFGEFTPEPTKEDADKIMKDMKF